MRRKSGYLTLFLFVCIASIMISCSSDLLVEEENETVQISFVLSLGEPAYVVRTTVGEEIGNYDYENKVVDTDLRVLLYDVTTLRLLGQVESMTVIRVNTNTYQFVGELTLEAGVGNQLNCQVMVFANCGDIATLSGKGNSNTLANLLYNYTPATFSPNASEVTKRYIPMWGTKKTQLSIAPGTRTDLGTIQLIRAMAKIKVKLDNSLTEWTINSVRHNLYNTAGGFVPSNYLLLSEAEQVSTPSIASAITPSSTSIDYITITAGREYILYLPEYNNKSTTQKSTIKINLKRNSESKDFTLYFKNYTEGDLVMQGEWDILRNYYYQFNITGVMEDVKTFYTVEAWNVRAVTIPGFE